MSVRRVAHEHPETREVFLRFGEEDDRTVFGHLEPLSHFAQRRGVQLDRLLNELATTSGLEVDRYALRDERLHRPFVLVAMAVTLSLGAGWGAYLLAQIGLQGSFEAASQAQVIAHGSAQLWGFVAPFIVGIALRYLVLASGRPSPPAAVRRSVLAALSLGVVSGFAWAQAPERLPVLAAVSGLAFLSGGVVYLILVLRCVAHLLRHNWARFVLASAVSLCVWGGVTLFLQTRAGAAGPGVFSGTERQVLMDLPLLGLALGSVYGFGRKLLPGLLSVPKPRAGAFEAAFWLHNGGLVLLLAGRWWAGPSWVAAGLCCVGGGALAYLVALRGLRGRAVTSSRGYPVHRLFIKLAFAWLLLATFWLAGMAVLEAAKGAVFPHALYGAARHALTVGFLVTVMLGVAQRLLPVLGNTRLAFPHLLMPIFLLLAAGNLLRVVSEVATLWWPPAFAVMPVSAALELTALALFAGVAWRTMWPARDLFLRSGEVTPHSLVANLLSVHPWLEDSLIGWGFSYLSRVRYLPQQLTIVELVEKQGVDLGQTIQRINDALRGHVWPAEGGSSPTATTRSSPRQQQGGDPW